MGGGKSPPATMESHDLALRADEVAHTLHANAYVAISISNVNCWFSKLMMMQRCLQFITSSMQIDDEFIEKQSGIGFGFSLICKRCVES